MTAVMATLPLTNLLGPVTPALQTVSGNLRQAVSTLRRQAQSFRDASGKVRRLTTEAQGAGGALGRFRADATTTATSTTKIGRTTAPRGVKSFGDKAGKAKGAFGKLSKGLGGILTILVPLLPVTDIITKLMDKFGMVMTVASVVMMAVNVAMRANPLGFLIGILLPVAAWLIEYAMNSEAGQRIIEQVMEQVFKGFESIWKYLQPVMEFLGDAVMTYFQGYLTVITAALTVIGAAVGGFSGTGSSVSSSSAALRGIASGAMGGIRSAIQPMLSFFTEQVPGFFRSANTAVGGAMRGFGELIKGALTSVSGVVTGPIKGLIAFANWIIDGLNKLSFDFLGKHFGVDIPKIPMLAEGGVVFPGSDTAPRIDPLTVLESRTVPALTEPPQPPHRIRDFHEDPSAGPRSTAEDLLFLMAAHA
ncbi:tape-measure protein [Streptomyces sp. NBC_01268]|uniref:tape-measure protein n=1 Tax=Streptomyces sp. NBC_01268 TaxID=2903806 RepID=UPI002E2EA86F|nr:tape-measure protein [Streptomyces sp. NBC_01268]